MSTGTRCLITLALLATMAPVIGLGAQSAPQADPEMIEANDVLRTCIDFMERRQVSEAQPPAQRAEAIFQRRLKRKPNDVEALVGLARATSQCLLPAADLLEQAELSGRAIELLEHALEIDPRHWTARFVLGSILYRSPSFLGRSPRAAKEFDELLRQQGDRTDNPRYARVFELRGLLFRRASKPDSALAMWSRGARLFPSDTALQAIVRSARPSSSPSAAPPRSTTSLTAVQVVASATPAALRPSQRQISRAQVLTTAGAAADVLQAVQMQPGATRVSEGSDVYTRGGDVGETSLLVNGGRLLSIARFEALNGGMFGALEPFVVQSVRYSSGGFSARYGNALSGVLEIETDGRPRERAMRAGMSLVQASGTLRVPMSNKVGGWINTRLSNAGPLLATHGRTAEFNGSPHSEEIVASMVANPSSLSEVRATALVERDGSRRIVNAAGWNGPFKAGASSEAIVLSSRWVSSSAPLTIRSSVVGSNRSTDWGFGVLARVRDEGSLMTRTDVEWAPSDAISIRGGAEQGALTRAESGSLPTSASVGPGSPVRNMLDEAMSANQLGGYAELDVLRHATSVTLGLRADRLPGERDVTIDPRLALTTRYSNWIVRVSGGLFHQGRWRADAAIPDAGRPSGTPKTATHLVLGIERELATGMLRAEAYHKRYADYSVFGAGPEITGGVSRGLDLIAQKSSKGWLTGWIAYSLLEAQLDLRDGQRVPSPFDVTQSVTLTLTAAVNADWSIGTSARYGTGAPITPVTTGKAEADGRIVPVYGAFMSDRLPAYARVDGRIMRYTRAQKYLLTSYVEILNLGGRANAAAVTYDEVYRTRSSVRTFFASRTFVVGGEVQLR